jgi:alpha-galactosidase
MRMEQHRIVLGALLACATFACAALGQDPAPDPRAATLPPNALWLETLDLSPLSQDWMRPRAGRSVDGNPLTIGGATYTHGIGTHAGSEYRIDLKGAATRFVADVGVDDEMKSSAGSVGFSVWLDGRLATYTGTIKGGQPAKRVSVDLTGARRMTLIVDDGGDGIDSDHADWAGAMILLAPGATDKPVALALPPPDPPLPIAMDNDGPTPAIHGPRVVGTTPGRPFLFRVPTTGDRPLTFSAKSLPEGLSLAPTTGILSGSLRAAGTYVIDLSVRGPKGTATRKLVLIGGKDRLARTPPLGWNSWNVWGTAVTADKVRAAADSLVSAGLADHGFAYVNIDDAWEGTRDASGVLQTNDKFGDMKALGDYVHARGLKLGIYSSPGPKTCAGYEGSYQHEAQDARTWAAWGIDYLKHDWCSYGDVATGKGLERLQKPYRVMREALDAADRDIVYSLCQYGMGNVWEWGGTAVGGNLWRTTGDITDTWQSMAGIGFKQNGHEKYAAPGRWNDPDMLVVGKLGWGPRLHPTRLTPNEQITHITLWSLLAAPLLIGCDLTQIDPFTRALLTNDEVLDVDQDPLGIPAGRKALRESPGVTLAGMSEIWSRPLFDGTQAVGLFNRGGEAMTVTVRWSDLGLQGRQTVRDLWQRKPLGVFADSYSARIPAHGALLLKVGKPVRTEYVP